MSVPYADIPAYPVDDAGRLVIAPSIQGLIGAGTTVQTRRVYLGRKAPKRGRAAINIGQFIDHLAGTPPPATSDFYTKALSSIRQVYGNAGSGAEGDCVIASGMHGLGCWSGNDSDSPGLIVGTSKEALSEYHRIGGPYDNGLVMSEALDDFVKTGLLCGGKRYKIDGWASVPQTKPMLQFCIPAFGGMRIGFNVPAEWMNNAYEGFVWDTPRSYSFVGGHDVRLCGTTPEGVKVSTWGLVGVMTWAAVLNPRIVDELYVEVSQNFINADRVSGSGFQYYQLQAAFAQVKAGQVPSWIDPVPPSPPVPPVPPNPPSPPPPPAPVPHVMTGKLTIPAVKLPDQTIQVPVGGIFGGTRSVTVPGQTIPEKTLPIVVTDAPSGFDEAIRQWLANTYPNG